MASVLAIFRVAIFYAHGSWISDIRLHAWACKHRVSSDRLDRYFQYLSHKKGRSKERPFRI